MRKPKNFLEMEFHPFHDSVLAAAEAGTLTNSKPFLDCLMRAQMIARGVATIARMQINNTVQEDTYGEGDPGEPPPVSDRSLNALSGLVLVACEDLESDIDSLAMWAAKNAIPDAPIASSPRAKAKGVA